MSETPDQDGDLPIKSVGAEKKPKIVEMKKEDQHHAQKADFVTEELEKEPGLARSRAIFRRTKTGKEWLGWAMLCI